MRRFPLALAVVTLLGFLAADAQAHKLIETGCGTPYAEATFTSQWDGAHLYINVAHEPGRWGEMGVTNVETNERVWSWRQPYSWIHGFYYMESPRFPAGSYRVEYWSDNHAQAPALCHGSIYVALPRNPNPPPSSPHCPPPPPFSLLPCGRT
jgi:hypothetical protein